MGANLAHMREEADMLAIGDGQECGVRRLARDAIGMGEGHDAVGCAVDDQKRHGKLAHGNVRLH